MQILYLHMGQEFFKGKPDKKFLNADKGIQINIAQNL